MYPWGQKERLLFDEHLRPRFPPFWQVPIKFKSVAKCLLMAEEQVDVEIIKRLPRLISTKAILSVPLSEDPAALFAGKILRRVVVIR